MSPVTQKSRNFPSDKDQGDGPEERNATLEVAVTELGICSKTRFPSSGSQLPPQDVITLLNTACTGAKNIVQRGSTRKGRVLCVFADRIKMVKGGTLGTIHDLDGDPHMDVTFPEGVMRFWGSLVFPENKYLSLKVGNREVVCEDVFDSILLFTEVDWLPEGDPKRKRKIRTSTSDIPESLRARKLHAGGEERKTRTENDKSPPQERSERPTRQRMQPARNVVVLDDDTDDTE